MYVEQQDVLVGTAVSSTPARGSRVGKKSTGRPERLRAQERYSRKDSIIILNPPYDARNVRDVTMNTLKCFKNFLGITIKYEGESMPCPAW